MLNLILYFSITLFSPSASSPVSSPVAKVAAPAPMVGHASATSLPSSTVGEGGTALRVTPKAPGPPPPTTLPAPTTTTTTTTVPAPGED
jgi:hypothetical protein